MALLHATRLRTGREKSRRRGSNPRPPPYHDAHGGPPGLVRSRPVWVFGAWEDPERPLPEVKHPQNAPRKPPKTPPGGRGVSGGHRESDPTRSAPGTLGLIVRADVAQLVEHLHGKEGVRGSSPRVGLAQNPLQQTISDRPMSSGGVLGELLGERIHPQEGRQAARLVHQPRLALSSIAMSVGRRRCCSRRSATWVANHSLWPAASAARRARFSTGTARA